MAVLAAALEVESRGPKTIRRFLMGTDIIYKGGLVNSNSSGLAVAGADTSGDSCLGVACETVNNSAAGADTWVDVFVSGCFKLELSSVEQPDTGRVLYVMDDRTVGDKTAATNDVAVGMLVELVSATYGWVEVGNTGRGLVVATG